MKTDYLKDFLVLTETMNFWEASELLYMNQSTLSKHIRSLEKELGVQLFKRTTRQVELTAFGTAFLPYARTLSAISDEALSELQKIQMGNQDLLTLGVIPSITEYDFTYQLSRFQKASPETRVRILEEDPINLFDSLIKNKCEMIFNREAANSYERSHIDGIPIVRIPFAKDRLVALLAADHPLAGNRSLTLEQLKKERFCFIKEGSLLYNVSFDACRRSGFVPNVIFTSHRIDTILDVVSSQNAVALLMDAQVKNTLPGSNNAKNKWVTIPITPITPTYLSLCYRGDKELSPTAQRFANFCRNSPVDPKGGLEPDQDHFLAV